MPRETVHVLAIFVATPGRAAALAHALSAMGEPTRQEAGSLRYDLTRALDGSGEFAFIEEWETAESLDAHGRSEHIREWGGKARELVAAPPKVMRYRQIL